MNENSEAVETSIIYDYKFNQVRIYTDRVSVIKDIKHRLGEKRLADEYVRFEGKFIYLPLSMCRKPSSVIHMARKRSEADELIIESEEDTEDD